MDYPSTKVKSFKFNRRKIEVPPVKPRAGLRDAVEVYGSEAAALAKLTEQRDRMAPEMDKFQTNAVELAITALEAGHDMREEGVDKFKASGTSAEILTDALGRDDIRQGSRGSYREPGVFFNYFTEAECSALSERGFILYMFRQP